MRRRAVWLCSFPALCFLAGVQSVAAEDGPCSAKGTTQIRKAMLDRFRSHYDDVKKGYFDQPHRKQPGNQLVMISKKDFYCGSAPVPQYYIEYVVKGARPVDVFNVLADTLSQPDWLCNGCTISLLKNDVKEQVQGFANTYRSVPVNRREFYMWQAVDADVEKNEFLVGAASRSNEPLHTLKNPERDATVGRMCYSFSRIRSHPEGALVVQMSHFDARVPFNYGPLSMRNMYHMVWPLMLQRVPKIIHRSVWQATRMWEANQLYIPQEFLDPGSGGVNKDLNTTVFSPTFHAKKAAPKINAKLAGAQGDDDMDPTMKSRLPWLCAALVLLVFFVCFLLFGLLAHCGCCNRWFPKKKPRTTTDSDWNQLDSEGQAEAEEEEE